MDRVSFVTRSAPSAANPCVTVRSRRALLIALAAAGCSLAVAGPATAGNQQHRPTVCGPTSARTLSFGRLGRAYAVGSTVYACSARTHQRTRLGDSTNCEGALLAAPVVVSGDYVAYGAEWCGVDFGSTSLVVRRLSSGMQVSHTPALKNPRPMVEAFTTVDTLALGPNGAAAWISSESSPAFSQGTVIQVDELDPGLKPLDSGAGIRLRSLRLHGSTLTWNHNAHTRTASLT
jgi:hypothetical protein